MAHLLCGLTPDRRQRSAVRTALLRRHVEDDLDAFAELIQHPQVLRYLGAQARIQNRGEALELLKASIRPPRTALTRAWAVADLRTGSCLGTCGLIGQIDGREAELFIALHPAHWRQGLGTRALRQLVRRAFRESCFTTVHARVDEENTAAQHIMKSADLRLVGGAFDARTGRWMQRYVRHRSSPDSAPRAKRPTGGL